MIFLKQNLQLLLRGYAIIRVQRREHQVCDTFYPTRRFKDILIVDVTIKIKKQIPDLRSLIWFAGAVQGH